MINRFPFALLAPALLTVVVLLGLPILLVLSESVHEYLPGYVGSAPDSPLTLQNYSELLAPAYTGFFLKTYYLSFIGAVLSVSISFPVAYFVARSADSILRNIVIGVLIMMLFLSALVRVISIEMTFGSVGLLRPLFTALLINMNSHAYLEVLIVAGLLHVTVPISSLTLIGTIQNINPRFAEAAQSLGASRLRAHLSVTVPLSLQGILSTFLIAFTLGVSAFVIPWILGKGRVLFVSNLIYSRFSETPNYPSGAAISIVMLVLSLLIVYLVSRVAGRAAME